MNRCCTCLFAALWEQLPRLLPGDRDELQHRCGALLDAGDDRTLATRAAALFADRGPAWPLSVFHSADVQIAAADLAAIEAGEFLAVVGDFHPGNPLTQSVFSTRHPDPDRFRAQWHADVGAPILAPVMMRNPVMRMTSRNIPDATNPDDIHLVGSRIVPTHVGYESAALSDLVVHGEVITDRAGKFRARLTDALFQPMFICAMKTFQPFADAGPRITVGNTVLRRETWRTRASPPARRGIRHAGLVRRPRPTPNKRSASSTGSAKPVYVDFDSPALTRNLHRMLGRATTNDPDASGPTSPKCSPPRSNVGSSTTAPATPANYASSPSTTLAAATAA